MTIKIDQALINQFVTQVTGIQVAHENLPYTPVNGTPYAELIAAPNESLALSLKDSNETTGVFRVILRYPPDAGAITAKNMADTIFSKYKVGQKISYSGQSVTILGNSREPGLPEDGWYKLVLTMRYWARVAR